MTPSNQEDYFGHDHETLIKPVTGWHMLNLRELWAYRELLWVLTMRDIKVRYKQTVLGVLWALIQPLLAMLIFTVVFGRLAKMPSDGLPYPIFVFAGLLPWTFFANAISQSGGSLVGSANLVSKVYFPRLIIPLASIGSGLVDFAVSFVILLIMMLSYNIGWSINLLAVPVLIFAVIFTALGIGTLLAALTVAYRDFKHIIPFMVQIWLYATPVVYPASLFPERWQWLLFINPMSGIIEAFRSAFLNQAFDWQGIAISFATAMIFFIIGIAYFERVERRFADII